MKNKLLKLGTFLLALTGITGDKIYGAEKADIQKIQTVDKVSETTPLYLDEAIPTNDNNTILSWHSSHSSHSSHKSHSSHYSSSFLA